MKIETLRLVAYGPFTDARVDFTGAGSDFHMVFGPNEAGKSSALRALRHMLFGIPVQTADNFRHAYANLRVGARLVAADGRCIDFLRRKGKVRTLRDADDESVLDDEALAPFLGGIDQAVFEQMFAIGHEDLVRGGQEIVSGRGRVGEALFAAGAGLIRLHAVQQGLEQECGALFRPGGSTPRINQILAALKDARRRQKEALLHEKTWQSHDRALRDAQARMATLRESLGQAKQQVARLQRIRDALPAMARRKELDAALAALEGVPDLADDFGDKRRAAERDLSIAGRDRQRSAEAIENLVGRIEALPVSESLLEHAAAIEALQHELGSFRKARKDRPGLEGRMRTLQQQAAEKLARLDRDLPDRSVDGIKLPPATIAEIQDLGKSFERLTARLETAKAQRQKLASRYNSLGDRRTAMPAPVDVTALEAAVAAAMEAGPVESRNSEMQTAAVSLEAELVRAVQRQTLWNGVPTDLDALPCPTRESIDRFDADFNEIRRRMDALGEKKAATESEIAGIRVELQAIDRARQVPGASDLHEARSLRDGGWGLIRRQLDGEAVGAEEVEAFVGCFDGAAGLPKAFEGSMQRADQIADRLWREAEQVSRKALLVARQKQLQEALAAIDGQTEAALAERGVVDGRWRDLWQPAGIVPLSPPEMRAWLSDVERLRAKLAELRSIRSQAETLARQRSALESGLRRALEGAGAPRPSEVTALPGLIQEARTRAAAQRDLEARIASLDRDLLNLKTEREEAAAAVAGLEKDLEDWQQNWHRNLALIGIDTAASPTAALAVIESLKEARSQIMEAEVLRKRIEGIDRDAAVFQTRVEELVNILVPDLASEPRDRAAELLNARLTAARQSDAERRGLKEQLAAAQKEQADAERRISRLTAAIEALRREAGCPTADALAETEQRAKTRKALLAERGELETRLRALGAGATVEAFIAEAAMVEPDRIGPELDELAETIEGLEQERSTLDQTIGSQRAELQRMDGGAEAAGFAETAEGLLASLQSEVENYARFKIASVILSRTVEQYREKHQGPLIARAGELFVQMTGGAFLRLRAEYDEKGNPVMAGVRASGETVAVDAMSDGTADQLYLALRLASLEQYLETSEPLPFVVDDILLRFDDRRALATLEVLSGLAARTQVIFFTHHRHLVDLAAAELGAGRMAFHELRAVRNGSR